MARCSLNSLRVCPLLSCNRSSNSRRLESARALKTSSIASDYATKWLHVKRTDVLHCGPNVMSSGVETSLRCFSMVQLIQRTLHSDAGLVEHVRVNHRRAHILVT